MAEPEILLGEMFVPVIDVVAAVLAEVLAIAERVMGERPEQVVLTYPYHWGSTQQERLAAAAEVAGIDKRRLQLVSEASAAAGYWSETGTDLPVGARLAVVDFGAGSCGVAVVDKQSDGSFTVMVADGLEGLGGHDLEARIHAWVHRQLAVVNPRLAAELSDKTNATRLVLSDRIRDAKEALSAAPSAAVMASGSAGIEVLPLTRAVFDQLISTDIDRLGRLTESVLFQADTIRRVDEPVTIYLTGGSSNIPLVRTRLSALGVVGNLDHPKTVVSQGALHATAIPAQPQFESPYDHAKSTSTQDDQRLLGTAATPRPPERARRIRITSTMRKWAAGLALLAIAASGVGIAAVMIFGSMTAPKPSQRTAAPRTTLAPPAPKVPTAMEFTIGVVVTDQICAPGPGCTYKYTIEPKYIGLHPLPETPFTVHYQVTGGNAPQDGEFTVTKDQAKIFKDVVLEGPPGAQLKAVVKQVTA
jgi:hypothetical protein